MKLAALAAALLLPVPALATVVTTKTPVTSAAWTDLGAGPLMLSFSGSGVYAVADMPPAIPATEGFSVLIGDTVKLKTTSHVWAMAVGAASVNAYSAPIVPAVSPNCTQAATYLARTTGGAEGGNALNIQNLICGLVSDGVITGDLSGATGGCGAFLDGLYIMAQQNVADAKLNLCGTSYPLTVNAATVFRPYIGFNNFPTGMDTGFNMTSAPGKRWSQNSANMGVWAYSTVSNTAGVFGGAVASANKTIMQIAYNDLQFWITINGGAGAARNIGAGMKGLLVGERPISTSLHHFYNGVDVVTNTSTSNGIDNADAIFGNVTGAADSGAALSEGHFGAALGATLNFALYNRLRVYMTAVGAP